MNFELTKEQKHWQEKAKEFARLHITPYVKQLEEDLNFRSRLFELMASEGFFLLSGNQDTITYLLALKEIAKADAGISVAMSVTNMVAETIYREGTPEQRDSYLSKIATGSCVPASFALTEKNAGSDAKNMKSSVVRNGGSYVLTGEKQFITNADMAGVTIVMAKTDSNSDTHNSSAFLVDKGTPGFTIVKKENKMGLLTANLVDIKFDECRLEGNKLLGKEGDGLGIALKALDGGRLGVAAQSLGIAESAYEAALAYAKQREQFGKPIAYQQAIAFKLADMRVKLSASELLMLKAAWKKDQGVPYTLEASEAKLFCSEAANEIATEALQIHGGYGYIKDYLVEKYFRDARVTTIYEGTSEIQRLVISRHILN